MDKREEEKTRATNSPRKPSSSGCELTKTQSYREWPLRQVGVARMYSCCMLRGPQGSLGDRKVADALRKTENFPSKTGHASMETQEDGTCA